MVRVLYFVLVNQASSAIDFFCCSRNLGLIWARNRCLNSSNFTFGIKGSTRITSICRLCFQAYEAELLTTWTFHVLACSDVLYKQATFDASTPGWTFGNANNFFLRTILKDLETRIMACTGGITYFKVIILINILHKVGNARYVRLNAHDLPLRAYLVVDTYWVGNFVG